MKSTRLLQIISATLLFFFTFSNAAVAQSVIYQENCGIPTTTTLIQNYAGWQDSTITYTGNGTCDVRISNASEGYGQASGGGNIMINDTVKWFQISGINTLADTNVSLYCGLRKTSTENGNNFVTEVSTDSLTWTRLFLSDTLPTGTGTSGWHRVRYRNIPTCSNLHIRFSNLRNVDYRLDDITLVSGEEETLATVATPTFTPTGGTYYEPQSVDIATTTSGAGIYYTMDGSTPTENSNLYLGTLTVNNNVTIKAIAFHEGMYRSEIAVASYTIRDTNSIAILPFDISNNSNIGHQDITMLEGFRPYHLGSSYADGSAKFESSQAGNAVLTVHFDSAPEKLSFDLKGKNGGSTPVGYEGVVMLVSESPDGHAWTTVATLNSPGISVDEYTHFANFTLQNSTRYIRWLLATATKGNTQLNNIAISKRTSSDSTVIFEHKFNAIDLYPNPTADKIFFNYEGSDILSVILYDIFGRVLQHPGDTPSGAISLSDYPAGIYILRIYAKNGTFEKKIVKY